MLVSDLIMSIRIAIDDTNATRYSDFTILNVVRGVFSNVTNLLNKHNSEILHKEATLTMVDNSCDLPADFVKFVSVQYNDEEVLPTAKLNANGYRVVGNTIKSKLPSLDIVYAYSFPDEVVDASTVTFPTHFIEYIKKYIVMVLTNNNSDASIAILPVMESDIVSLANDRRYAYIDRELPFQI